MDPKPPGDDAETGSRTPHQELWLDNQLCFSLYAASRAVTKVYREKLAALGLTYPQYLVLIVLWEQDRQTVSDLGRKLMLDTGTLTPLLKRLESMGLVERQRSRGDERQVHIVLTEAGRALQEGCLDARSHVTCRLDMSEQDIRALRERVMEVIEKLDTLR